MVRSLVVVLLCVFLWSFAAPAVADVPLPDDRQVIDPPVRFEGIEALPDQVFFLRYLTFIGAPTGVPHRLVRVTGPEVIDLNAERRLGDMQLLSLDKKSFDEREAADSSLKWLTPTAEGVLVADLETPPTTAPANLQEIPVTTYRVELEDGKLSAQTVAAPPAATPVAATGNALRNWQRGSTWATWPAGLAIAFALVAFGLWWTRRRSAARGRPTPGDGQQSS